ncbi:Membrane associated serine protease, rhomboid family [Rubritalea squalenifaciens DSM 18772]|uniref:Membrane associated serine protease, rhomboid family n=1 Tax=Rubritalea squalenifaciens DSM 18772 TaxID=1123071 RepID=A0A1M6PG79_9BACT|nr:rhomboid family intramembrane serine protease [Rubritalea squalenifaciens]SHK06965.1 Membrane associated serine protease, rhomboid family [Rubritalea squalenifaciens DSM 18772]
MIDKNVRTVGFYTLEKKRAWWRKVTLPKPGFDVITLTCVALLLIHFVIELKGGALYWRPLYFSLGLSHEGIMAGKVWQLFSYALLHGNWPHVLANVLMLWLIGGRVQAIIGQKKLALTLLAGVFLGGVFHLMADLMTGPEGWRLLVGASGAVIALLLLLTSLSPDSKMFPIPVSSRNLGLGVMMASLLLALMRPSMGVPGLSQAGLWISSLGFESMLSQVAHACHFGGGVAGLLMARVVYGRKVTLEYLQKQRRKREGN